MKNYKCGFCYSIPTLCHIETTYKCNQNCLFCYNPKRENEIDFNKLDNIIKSVANSKIPHVYLSGGEPSLLPIKKINEYINLLSPNSSITILTNGLKTMKGLSKDIACLGIPIHGTNAEEHEAMTQIRGSYEKLIESIKYYVAEGFEVRCILVLTGYNYNKMYQLIKNAEKLGMESVYVDRYEDGGIGSTNSKTKQLKPTLEQFRIALKQILKARKDCKKLKGKVGFGTAIPFCLDKKLLKCNIASNCGVGTNFCAINSEGDFRICNQSEVVFGNVLNESIKDLWNKREMSCFRDLSWVQEPCKSCSALKDCVGGCKVDVNYSNTFCIDYAVRNDIDKKVKDCIQFINKNYNKVKKTEKINVKLSLKNKFKIDSYTKINEESDDILLVTRYQTVVIDEIVKLIITDITKGDIKNGKELLEKYNLSNKEALRVLKTLLYISAIDLI